MHDVAAAAAYVASGHNLHVDEELLPMLFEYVPTINYKTCGKEIKLTNLDYKAL